MFRGNKVKKEKIERGRLIKVFGIFVFIFQAITWLFLFFKPHRFKKFLKGETREIKEISTGQETWHKFFNDSGNLLRDLFIPHQGNNHKPKSLRPKTLATYVIAAILVKVFVTSFLFITYPTPAELSAIISSNIINLINESRVEAEVEPLSENNLLVNFAQNKGQDMIVRDYFAHNTPEGKKPWQWINRGEYDYVYAGENLAMDFTSAEVVHNALMKSPTHRDNILNPKYKEIGIAVINGELNGHKTVLLVEFFGTQRKDLSSVALVDTQKNDKNDKNTEIEHAMGNAIIAGETLDEIPSPQTKVFNPQPMSQGMIVVTTHAKPTKALVDLVIEYSNIFFIAFLIFILISLALNVFVHIRVQHTSVILQSIVVLAVLVAVMLIKFHFIEQVAPQILII